MRQLDTVEFRLLRAIQGWVASRYERLARRWYVDPRLRPDTQPGEHELTTRLRHAVFAVGEVVTTAEDAGVNEGSLAHLRTAHGLLAEQLAAHLDGKAKW